MPDENASPRNALSDKAKGKRRADHEEPEGRAAKRQRVSREEPTTRATAGPSRPAGREVSVVKIAALPEGSGSERDEESSEDEVDELIETDVPLPPVKIKRRRRPQAESVAEGAAVPAGIPSHASLPARNRAPLEMLAEEYPVTSTPQKGVSIELSEAIPSPRSLEAAPKPVSRAAQRAARVAQEPTPPTSDAPLPPPHPLPSAKKARSPSPVEEEAPLGGAADGDPSADEHSESRQSTPSPPQKKSKRKQPLQASDHDSNPFESDGAASSNSQQRRALARGRATSTARGAKPPSKGSQRDRNVPAIAMEEEEEEEVDMVKWPPPRSQAGFSPARAEIAPASQGSKRAHHPFSQPTQAGAQTQTDGAGPSSRKHRAKAAVEHHPFSDVEDSQISEPTTKPVSMAKKLLDAFRLWSSHEHPGPSSTSRDAPDAISRPASKSTRDTAGQPSSSHLQAGLAPFPSASKGKGKAKAGQMLPPDEIPNRRHTLAALPPFVPDDQARQLKPTSISDTRETSSSPIISAPAPMKLNYGDVVLDPRDHPAVYRTMLRQAVKKTGWPRDIVLGAWRTTGSWTATIEVLTAERVKEATSRAIIEEMEERSRGHSSTSAVDESMDEDDKVASGRGETIAGPSKGVQEKDGVETQTQTQTQREYYTPPDDSRAAIYLREHGLPKTPEEPEVTWGTEDADESAGQVTEMLQGMDEDPPTPHVATAKRILAARKRR